MIIKGKNFSFQDPQCNDGDTFEQCNITQALYGTKVCAGKTGLTFKNCSLINCVLPDDVIVITSNRAEYEFCSNNFFRDVGIVPKCLIHCKHEVGVEPSGIIIYKNKLLKSQLSAEIN